MIENITVTHDHRTVAGLNGRCIHGLSRTHGGISCGKFDGDEMHARNVDLAELTSRLKLDPSAQRAVAAFVNDEGPWTEETARELVLVWHTVSNDTA